MKKLVSFIFFSIYFIISYSQDKRGMAYGFHSPEDLEILSPSFFGGIIGWN